MYACAITTMLSEEGTLKLKIPVADVVSWASGFELRKIVTTCSYKSSYRLIDSTPSPTQVTVSMVLSSDTSFWFVEASSARTSKSGILMIRPSSQLIAEPLRTTRSVLTSALTGTTGRDGVRPAASASGAFSLHASSKVAPIRPRAESVGHAALNLFRVV